MPCHGALLSVLGCTKGFNEEEEEEERGGDWTCAWYMVFQVKRVGCCVGKRRSMGREGEEFEAGRPNRGKKREEKGREREGEDQAGSDGFGKLGQAAVEPLDRPASCSPLLIKCLL